MKWRIAIWLPATTRAQANKCTATLVFKHRRSSGKRNASHTVTGAKTTHGSHSGNVIPKASAMLR
jgi:hypothetical protein